MPATDLRRALNILDPESPLRTEEELREYFVARPLSPLADLRLLLEASDDPQKILFSGHTGSGKSTELAKLSHELRDQFFIVQYSIRSVLNLFDLSYVDVLLSLGLQLVRAATEREMGVNQAVLGQILDFAKDITRDVETGVKGQADVGTELNLYVVKLSSKLGTEDATRTTVREKVTHRLSDLLDNVDVLAREVEKSTGRRLLVVVEDLDKTDPGTATEIFFGHAGSLAAPRVSVIYTFPTAIRHSNDFIQVRASFPKVYVLPNVKTKLRDGRRDADGLRRLSEMLTKRVDRSLFTAGALTCLAECSSGIPRDLIALAQQACLEAMKAEQAVIDKAAVDRAAQSRRIDWQVLLTSERLELLKRVQQTKRVENDDAHRALLHNLSALEYRNDSVWYDVHPIVEPLLAPAG